MIWVSIEFCVVLISRILDFERLPTLNAFRHVGMLRTRCLPGGWCRALRCLLT
jgi:hypothetical protein